MTAIDAHVGRARARRARPVTLALEGRWLLTAGACATTVAAGTVLVALADRLALRQAAGAQALFWLGLVAIVAPVAARLAGRDVDRRERLLLVVAAGLGLYLVKVLHSPIALTLHDEFSSLRATNDILDSGRLFAPDPLIPVHPHYPVLQVLTAAVSSVTGLSAFHAGLGVLGAGRVLLMVALFLLFERVLPGPRVASLATIVYVANPNFVFFDAQFAYESVALPLVAAALWMLARRGDMPSGRRGFDALAALVVAGVALAHPMTSYALAAFLCLWAAVERHPVMRRAAHAERVSVGPFALLAVAVAIGWALVGRTGVADYLWPVLRDAVRGAVHLAQGDTPHKRLFHGDGEGAGSPLEQVAGYGAPLVLLAGLAGGARVLWGRRHTLSALQVALCIVACAYPVLLLARFGQSATEISNRSSEFVFVGVAFVVAIGLEQRGGGRLIPPFMAVAAALLVAGGTIVGWAPYARLPGPYLVGADPRSVSAEGVGASTWAATGLPRDSRILTDRSTGLLFGAYGHHRPVVGSVAGRRVLTVVTAPALGPRERAIIRADHLAFIVIDRRIATALPRVGFYFERDEPGAYEHAAPIPAAALQKFDTAPGVSRIFDSGEISVYDVRAIAREPTP